MVSWYGEAYQRINKCDAFYLIVSNYEDAQRHSVLFNVSWIKLSVLDFILKALSVPEGLTV